MKKFVLMLSMGLMLISCSEEGGGSVSTGRGCGKVFKVFNDSNSRSLVSVDGSYLYSGAYPVLFDEQLIFPLCSTGQVSVEFDLVPPSLNEDHTFFIACDEGVKILEVQSKGISSGKEYTADLNIELDFNKEVLQLGELGENDVQLCYDVFHDLLEGLREAEFERFPVEVCKDLTSKMESLDGAVEFVFVASPEDVEVLEGVKTVLFRVKENRVRDLPTHCLYEVTGSSGERFFIESLVVARSELDERLFLMYDSDWVELRE